MAKFSGMVGYVSTIKTSPGVWSPVEETRKYKGDLISDYRKWVKADGANDNMTINNQIRIIADHFALTNLGNMRWVMINGVKWKISSAEISYPNIVLTVGGVYNG